MAVKRIGPKIHEYICATTDSVYPTDCPVGSKLKIVDEATHAVTANKIFDGVEWNTDTSIVV